MDSELADKKNNDPIIQINVVKSKDKNKRKLSRMKTRKYSTSHDKDPQLQQDNADLKHNSLPEIDFPNKIIIPKVNKPMIFGKID